MDRTSREYASIPISVDVDSIKTETVTLRDGRSLAYARYGKPGGRPVYYFHGCPGSRYEPALSDDPAAEAGYEVFALERPGCGQSSQAPGYKMLDWTSDVVQFAEHHGHVEFGIIGMSGGGPYIDACTYAIPERLTFAYDLAGWGPVIQEESLQAELAPLDRFFLKRAASGGLLFTIPFSLVGLAARKMSSRGFTRALRSSMGEDDSLLTATNEGLRHFFQDLVAESFAQGSRGPVNDALRCYDHWGFDVRDIDYPLQIWCGTDDKFASPKFAEFKHSVVKKSTLRSFEGRGHLFFAMIHETLFGEL